MKDLMNGPSQKNLEAKNFGLSPDDFQLLLEELWSGRDELYQRVFLSHFKDCLTFLKKQYRASHQDAYDASMDTLLIFCDRLKRGRIKYGNLRFLFTQMAGQVYLKNNRQNTKYADWPDHLDMSTETTENIPDDALKAFEKAWPQLGEPCRGLLKAFFYDKQKLKDIAQRQARSEVALRKQKQRCMGKLQAIFKKQYSL
ncbi:MAG: hypothetical protein AAFO03_13825 [Bacteroidota bacterium]